MVTRRPRSTSSRPSEAAAIPLPREETTPPVTKMNFVGCVAAAFDGAAAFWLGMARCRVAMDYGAMRALRVFPRGPLGVGAREVRFGVDARRRRVGDDGDADRDAVRERT